MHVNKLNINDTLPLTCSRSGFCCHGNVVMLNPWELYALAKAKKITPAAFRDLNCDWGGILLKFNGKLAWNGKKACSQYVDQIGCSVYSGRPLACRLYPLGRQIQNGAVHYIHQGEKFPCLTHCAEVLDLPKMNVGDYLKGQVASQFELAQDEYLELMQNIADMAFSYLLDTGLASSGDKKTLYQWRKMGKATPQTLVRTIGETWTNYLMIPELPQTIEDPQLFVQKHTEFLQLKIHETWGASTNLIEFQQASTLLMGIALLLARALGANPNGLVQDWINTAKSYGAKE